MDNINTDPVVATEIMDFLGVGADSLTIPYFVSRIKDIAEFLGKVPTSTERNLLMRKITAGKSNDEKLNILWTFCRLREDYNDACDSKSDIEDQMEEIEMKNKDYMTDKKYNDLLKSSAEYDKKISLLRSELDNY